jgi:hypothetical protein
MLNTFMFTIRAFEKSTGARRLRKADLTTARNVSEVLKKNASFCEVVRTELKM